LHLEKFRQGQELGTALPFTILGLAKTRSVSVTQQYYSHQQHTIMEVVHMKPIVELCLQHVQHHCRKGRCCFTFV